MASSAGFAVSEGLGAAGAPPSLDLGGNFGDEPPALVGAEPFALSVTDLAGGLGELVVDLAVDLGASSTLCDDWPNLDVALEAGFLPDLVGVLGGLEVLPAAGDGAILLDVWAVCGEGVLEEVEAVLSGGEDRLGVAGKE